jgi:hypothetical protein
MRCESECLLPSVRRIEIISSPKAFLANRIILRRPDGLSNHGQFPLGGRGNKFLPPNGHILGGLDPKADFVAPDLHDGHFDATVDQDGFVFMAAEYQHDRPPCKSSIMFPNNGRACSPAEKFNKVVRL